MTARPRLCGRTGLFTALLLGACSTGVDSGSTPEKNNDGPVAQAAGPGDSMQLSLAKATYDSARAWSHAGVEAEQVIPLYLRSAHAFERCGDPGRIGRLSCYGGIVALTHRSAQADTALRYTLLADSIIVSEPGLFERSELAMPMRFFARAFIDARMFEKARRYATQALAHEREAGSLMGVVLAQDALADACARMGDARAAIALGQAQLRLLRPLLDTARTTGHEFRKQLDHTFGILAESYLQVGAFDSALMVQREAVSELNGHPELAHLQATALYNLGISHSTFTGRYDSAVHYLERAEGVGSSGAVPGREAVQARAWLAIAYCVEEDFDRAHQLARAELDREFAYFSETPHIDWKRTDINLLQLLDCYACVFEEMFHRRQDTAAAEVACRLNDDVMRGHAVIHADADPAVLIGSSRFRSVHMNRYISFMGASKSNHAPAGKLAELFETKRSDQLRAQLASVEESGLGGHHVRAYRKLTAERSLLATDGQLPDKARRLAQLDRGIDSVRNLIKGFSSSSGAVDGDLLLARVRNAIDDSTLVLNYSWADDANGAFLQMLAISKSGHWFQLRPLRPNLDSLVTAHVTALRTGSRPGGDGALWELLQPDGAKALRHTKLIIIPDGPLNALPFESLWVKEEVGGYGWLDDRCTVQYEYCLTFVADTGRHEHTGDLFALAPSFTTGDTSWSALAEEGSLKQAARSFLRSGPGPLTENIPEAEQAAALLHGRVLKGSEVSEEDLRRALPGCGVLHFATHAVCSSELPELSGILLAPVVTTGGTRSTDSTLFERNDGVLHAYEIQSMDIPAELVVLSACETAVGKNRLGEGAMSLARAFKYAGAKSIVSSLWKVDDLATKEIMVKFYEHLAEGMGKADALAEAKRWYRRTYPNEPPSKWAAFILIGDNEPVRLKKRSPVRPWMWVTGGLVLLLAGTVVWRRTRRAAA